MASQSTMASSGLVRRFFFFFLDCPALWPAARWTCRPSQLVVW